MMVALCAYSALTHANVIGWVLFLLVILPFGSGSGILTSAKRGELDLLLGSGTTRSRVWATTVMRLVVLPTIIVVAAAVSTGVRFAQPLSTASMIIRLGGTLLFTTGICFATGIVENRYVPGVLWFFLRFVVIVSDLVRDVRAALVRSPADLSAKTKVLAMIAIPELVMDRIGEGYIVAAALAGVSALAVSYWCFRRADLGGKRA